MHCTATLEYRLLIRFPWQCYSTTGHGGFSHKSRTLNGRRDYTSQMMTRILDTQDIKDTISWTSFYTLLFCRWMQRGSFAIAQFLLFRAYMFGPSVHFHVYVSTSTTRLGYVFRLYVLFCLIDVVFGLLEAFTICQLLILMYYIFPRAAYVLYCTISRLCSYVMTLIICLFCFATYTHAISSFLQPNNMHLLFCCRID
jgi:hypothetical protein